MMHISDTLQVTLESFSNLKILFVDDAPGERDLFVVRFSAVGARVTAVATVAEALEALDPSYDLLVSDLRLDGEHGYDLVRALRSLPASRGGTVPAVAVSGFADERTRLAAIESGFNGILAKPYLEEDLLGVVREIAPLIVSQRDYSAALELQKREKKPLKERMSRRRVQLELQRQSLAQRYARPRAAAARAGSGR